MPGYIKEALLKLQREPTKTPQDDPHRWNQPLYGAKTQYDDNDNAELLDAQSTLYVQKVFGDFLYYAIDIYQTMSVVLITITTLQSHSTTTTMGDIVWLLIHAATHPDATLHYHARNMILHVA